MHYIRTILHKVHIIVLDIEHSIWRLLIRNKDFTIISNNCWGGAIYQYLKLPYKSPTIGLIIFPSDYIKFCGNLEWYLSQELHFIDIRQGKFYNRLTSIGGGFPVGILGDIEIYFMHYKTEEEAKEKWNRRKNRINYSKILFKLSERDGCTFDDVRKFSEIPGSKVIFTKNKYLDIPDSVYCPELVQADKIGVSEVGITLKHCNIVRLINSI